MVQVDVFWAYAFGGSLADAGGDKLTEERHPVANKYFTYTLLFLCISWAPTGMYLLAQHTSWETMQVYNDLSAIPPWLIVAFGLTNITQGILGFFVSRHFIKAGYRKLATINWMAGYFFMFFILIYGWDGTGLDRFLYDRDCFGGLPWSVGAGLGEGAGFNFLTSSVAKTLYVEGIWLLAPFFVLFGAWKQMDKGVSPVAAVGKHLFQIGMVVLPLALLSAGIGWWWLF